MSVLMLSICRALREEVYRASITRASQGEGSNAPLIEKILALRQEKAHLLGYPNHAEVSMASKVGRKIHSSTLNMANTKVCPPDSKLWSLVGMCAQAKCKQP